MKPPRTLRILKYGVGVYRGHDYTGDGQVYITGQRGKGNRSQILVGAR